MTLEQAITILKKNPKSKVGSKSCRAYMQNLSSLKGWIFGVKSDDHKQFLKAKDWRVEE